MNVCEQREGVMGLQYCYAMHENKQYMASATEKQDEPL